MFEGYAAGINARLDDIQRDPGLLPKQYSDFKFNPEPWNAFDVAMLFVGTMLNRFGDFNTEPADLKILMALKEKHGPMPDRQEGHDNRDGKYDELGTAIFRTFFSHMIQETLADDLDKAFPFFAGPGYPTPEKPMTSGLNLQIGTKAIAESLLAPADQKFDFFNGEPPESVALKALTAALNELEKTYGNDMADWRIPAAPMGFVASDGTPDKHYGDFDNSQMISQKINA